MWFLLPHCSMPDETDPSALPADALLLIVSSLALHGFPPPMPGCERRRCVGCGRDVWAAPSTVHAEKVRRVAHCCQPCAVQAAGELGGLPSVGRLRGADADVRSRGSRVSVEGEEATRRALTKRIRSGRAPRR